MCGTLCEPSTITIAPTECAFFIISFIGFIVPKTFETCVIPTILTPGTIFLSISSVVSSPFEFVYMYSSLAPFF